MTGEKLSDGSTTTYPINRSSTSAFESELLQQVLEKMNELIT